MASGFQQRFKGKIKAAVIYLDSGAGNGIQLKAGSNFVQQPNVWSNAGAPTNGTNGTFAGFANPGDLLVDATDLAFYQNTNTLASPTWTTVGPAGGAFSVTTLTASGLITGTVAAGITASATQTQAGATQLTKQVNNIATCATSGNAVKLPAATVGQVIVVFNNGADPASVFPLGAGDTIDGGAAAAAVTLTNGKRAAFYCIAANTWISAQLGVASA